MVKKYGDIISGTAILIFSIVVYINTFTFKAITVSKIGSGFMPKLVAALLGILSIFVILNGVKEAKKQAAASTDKDTNESNAVDRNAVIVSFVIIAGYIAFLESVGFIIMTAVYLFAQMIVLTTKPQRKLVLFAILSLVISGVIYASFVYGFQLMLPTGILG
jgi:putative tricarboxylic transport membrane protein